MNYLSIGKMWYNRIEISFCTLHQNSYSSFYWYNQPKQHILYFYASYQNVYRENEEKSIKNISSYLMYLDVFLMYLSWYWCMKYRSQTIDVSLKYEMPKGPSFFMFLDCNIFNFHVSIDTITFCVENFPDGTRQTWCYE